MREQLKYGYYLLQKLIGRDRSLLEGMRQNGLITVLNLHHVSPENNAYWPPLTPEIFDDLLAFLKENFEVVLFRDVPDASADRPLAILSFDDGYYDFIDHALPMLDRYRLRANMNVIPQCVESGQPIWNVRLYDFLNAAPRALIDEIRLPGFDDRLASDRPGDKMRYGLAISRFLKNRPRAEREEIFQHLEPVLAKLEFRGTRMMSVGEVSQIATEHEIGAHSFSHESMEFESDEFFDADIAACKEYFESNLGFPMLTYAFPNGSHRPEQISQLKSQGIKNILLVGEDYSRLGSNVFSRFTIYGSTKLETRFQALGGRGKI